jgi:hypothetical protein
MKRHDTTAVTFWLFAPTFASFAAAPNPHAVESLANLPLAFEKNQGQAPRTIDYLARAGGYGVFLSNGNAHISVRRAGSAAPVGVELRLLGVREGLSADGREPLPGHVNYFIGDDPSRWRTDTPTFGRVEYSGVYPGIDLAY